MVNRVTLWSGIGIGFIVVLAGCDDRMEVIEGGQRLGGDAGGSGGAGSCAADGAGGSRTGADRQVRDMTPEEAEAWCESYVNERYPLTTPSPAPPDLPESQGYVAGYGCVLCWDTPGGACMMQPSVTDCVANLMHAPCEGTIAALDQCVDTFLGEHKAGACTTVDQTCAPFRQAPHCMETVITPCGSPGGDGVGGNQDGCYLRVSAGCD